MVEQIGELDDVLEAELDELIVELVSLHDWMLAHTTLSADEKRAVAARAFDGYSRSPHPIELRRQGTDLHRKLRSQLPSPTSAPPDRDDELALLFAEIDRLTKAGEISRSLPELLADYLHTQTFRLITGWPTLPNVEPLAYVVLEKCYASIAARARASR